MDIDPRLQEKRLPKVLDSDSVHGVQESRHDVTCCLRGLSHTAHFTQVCRGVGRKGVRTDERRVTGAAGAGLAVVTAAAAAVPAVAAIA